MRQTSPSMRAACEFLRARQTARQRRRSRQSLLALVVLAGVMLLILAGAG